MHNGEFPLGRFLSHGSGGHGEARKMRATTAPRFKRALPFHNSSTTETRPEMTAQQRNAVIATADPRVQQEVRRLRSFPADLIKATCG